MNALILHPIGYNDRPRGHEVDHWAHLCETLTKRGHFMLPEDRVSEIDVLIFSSDVWHIDGQGTTCPYNWNVLNAVLRNRTPVVYVDYFDHSGDNKSQGRWPGVEDFIDCKRLEPWPKDQWAKFAWMMSRPGACRHLYLMRKCQIHQDYPKWVYPLEYPILEDFPLTSFEELTNRTIDVCGLANISLQRAQAMLGLYKHGYEKLRLDVEVVPHYRRVDYNAWLDRHRNARMVLDVDASLGSERSLRLFSIAPILRVKSDHRLPFPRQDMVHYVEIGDYDGHVSKDDVDKVVSVVRDPELLYRIYAQGAEHMRKHYSLAARSNYVVDLVEKFQRGEI